MNIDVTPVNDPPVAVNDTRTTAEDTPVTVTVLANDSDVDGDTLSVTGVVTGANTHGAVVINADGTITYTPTANYNGAASFDYTISDGHGGTATATVNIDVTPVNDAPVGVSDVGSALEAGVAAGSNASGNVLTNDTDVDTGDTRSVASVTFGATTVAAGSALSGTYGQLTLNADGTYSYSVSNANPTVDALRVFSDTVTDTFTYSVKDAAGASSTTTLTITVHGADDAPVAKADVGTAVEAGIAAGSNATGNVLPNDTDVDAGDSKTVTTVTFGATTASAGTALSGAYGQLTLGANGAYTYVVNDANPTVNALQAGQNLTEIFTYTMKDTFGATSSTTLTITVNGANDPPDAVNDSGSTAMNTPIAFTSAALLANDTDPEHDPLSVTSVQAAQHGTVSLVGGVATFTPTTGYTGAASFSYTISDGHGGADTATVDITINSATPTGPGVGTPGFWSNLGAVYWDGKVDAAGTKHGGNFPTGELTYMVDSNGNGSVDSNQFLLIGDFNHNGITDAGEHTLVLSLTDAFSLVSGGATSDPLVKVGRDLVTTWLNYLEGNPVGSPAAANTPAWFVEEAVDWFAKLVGTTVSVGGGIDTYAAMSGGHFLNAASSSTITNAFNSGINVDATPGVQSGGIDVMAGTTLHDTLDYFNNTGKIGSTIWALDRD